ncbi:ParB N-terminal domain-containing protein [Croceitalea marina]|uniref:ParB N-terminal domain-containing protein n=1 Tax=Croceitalea marina TaxID=1775166 RepID=A0ABW5N291_9FLAO
MKLDLNDFDKDELKRYNRIKNLQAKELQEITPRWAVDEHVDKCSHPDFLPNSDYIMVNLNLPKLISSSQFGELNPSKLITDDINDWRYVEIIERWGKGKFIDPPTITPHNKTKQITYIDGRHRTIAAYLTGAQTIPVAVHKTFPIENLDYLK